MLLSSKDPAESVTLTFDFSALTPSISNPVVTSVTSVGVNGDPNPTAIVQQAPSASGAKAMLQVFGGISGCSYLVKVSALAADGISTYTLAGTLPVNSL